MSYNSNLMTFGCNDEDFWDDSELIKAYEDSVKFKKLLKANGITDNSEVEESRSPGPWEEVKEVISSANGPTILNSENSESSLTALRQKKKGATQNWKVGSKCRAIYSEDNIEYEANITEIVDDGTSVVVKFVGYENEEQVEVVSLSKSHGKNTRERQQREAEAYYAHGYSHYSEGLTHLGSAIDFMNLNGSQNIPSDLEETEGSNARNTSSFENTSFGNGLLAFGRPQEGIDNVIKSAHVGKARPIPASKKSFPKMFVPPLPTSLTDVCDGQNSGKGGIQSLLMAWYMTGYHSGYFDAKQDLKKSTAAAKRAHGS